MTNDKKPKYLYRGIRIQQEDLENFEFYGVDLKPPKPPLIDEEGRKTVGDGNEYGVYMSDVEEVAISYYARVSKNDGTFLNERLRYADQDGTAQRVSIPAIGIVYKIDTDGLDVRKPDVIPVWGGKDGMYNNGAGGNEWISESVPSTNYSIMSVEIGPDDLHESQIIDIENITKVKDNVCDIINARRERLELFEKQIEALPDMKRFSRAGNDINNIKVLKQIYKLNGIMDIDLSNYEPQNANEYIDYLMAISYSRDKDNLNLKELGYIESLRERALNPEELVDVLSNDIKSTEKGITKLLDSNPNYPTEGYEQKHQMIIALKLQLEEKIKIHIKSNDSVSTQKLGEETLDIQKSHKRMDDVENVVNEHRAERQESTKESTTEYDKMSFKDRMKSQINSDEYAQEVLTKFTQDLENGTLDNQGQKNNDDYNPEKGDDDYVM